MLNGDVLTDIDLTAQIAQHERTGARATLALVAGRGPPRLRPRAARRRTARVTRVRREARAGPDRHATTSPPAPTCSSARVLELLEPASRASIERDVFPRLVGNGLYGYVGERLLAGHRHARALPAGHFDILEGTVAHAGRRPDGRRLTSASSDGVENAGASSRRRWSRPAAGSATGARIGGRVVLERGVSVGEGTTIERAVVLRAPRSARTARCAAASSPRRADRRPRPRSTGWACSARASRSAPTTWSPTARGCSRASSCPTRRCGSDVERPMRLDAASGRGGRLTGQLAEILDLPEHLRDALWRVESAGIEPVDAPGGLIVAGMGGSAIGGRLAAARSATALHAAARGRRGYGLPRLGDARHARAVLELLGRDRGDARRLRRRARRAARRGSWRPPAARSPSARGATACR